MFLCFTSTETWISGVSQVPFDLFLVTFYYTYHMGQTKVMKMHGVKENSYDQNIQDHTIKMVQQEVEIKLIQKLYILL